MAVSYYTSLFCATFIFQTRPSIGCNKTIDEFGEIATMHVRKAQKRLTPEEIEMLIIEYQAGRTPIELSAKYGCHRITVTKILKRNGVEIRPHSGCKTKRDNAAIIAGYQAGKSTYTLAPEFSCDPNTISKILKENNIEVSGRKAQNKLNVEKVVDMYMEMHTTKEIAQQFGVSPKAILKCLREQNIKIRSRWDYATE